MLTSKDYREIYTRTRTDYRVNKAKYKYDSDMDSFTDSSFIGRQAALIDDQNQDLAEHEKREKITKNLVSLAAILAAMRVLKKRHNNKEINKLFDELDEINDKIKDMSKKRNLSDQDIHKVELLQAEAKMIETKIKRLSKK